MSTPVFVDPEISTQGDGAQSSRVPVPLPEDPYEAITPPTSPPESTPPTLVPILCSIAHMAVRVPPAMSPGLSTSMAEVVVMFESAFRKRFRSSYESSSSSSPPDLPLQKRYRGTFELVEDDDEEDTDIEESLHSDSVSEDEGPTAEDEDPASGTRFLLRGTRALGRRRRLYLRVSRDGSGSAPESERPKRVSASKHPTLTTWTDSKDGMVYIDVPAYPSPAPPIQTPPSPEWSSRSLPISPAPSIIPSPISSPMIPLIVPSPLATPATAETEGFLTELGARVEMQGD
ncbi:hypothetical protein Tco_0770595 [Tanacetum coccineum]|uniref:Uncharacterized protein n=1 Tax=Tanacetum coccineum TaxID=301880 RepID=A0ABQ4ZCN0_9ASTR